MLDVTKNHIAKETVGRRSVKIVLLNLNGHF